MPISWSSSGSVTEVSTTSGAAPGKTVVTETIGGSTSGSSRFGSAQQRDRAEQHDHERHHRREHGPLDADLGDPHEPDPSPRAALGAPRRRGRASAGAARAQLAALDHLVGAGGDDRVARREAERDLDAAVLAQPDLDRHALGEPRRRTRQTKVPSRSKTSAESGTSSAFSRCAISASTFANRPGTQPAVGVRHPGLEDASGASALERRRDEEDLAGKDLVGIRRAPRARPARRCARTRTALLGDREGELEPVDRVDPDERLLVRDAVARRDQARAHHAVEGRADPRALERHAARGRRAPWPPPARPRRGPSARRRRRRGSPAAGSGPRPPARDRDWRPPRSAGPAARRRAAGRARCPS